MASTPGTRARLAVIGACLLVSFAFAGIGAPSAGAAWGSLGFFGNPTTAGSTKGGEFGVLTGGVNTGTSPRGVAINDPAVTDGHGVEGDVYVADAQNNRIQQFDADGNFIRAWGTDVVDGVNFPGAPNNANEMRAVMVNANAGQFTLSFGAGGLGASSTGPLDFDATAAEVETALNGLTNISNGGGSVGVSGGPGNQGGNTPYLVNFNGGPLASTDVTTSFTGASAGLGGGTGTGANTVTVSTFAEGGGTGGFEICDTTTTPANTAAQCKAGTAASASVAPGGGMAVPSGIAVNQDTGHVYVTSGNAGQGMQRVDQFDAHGNFIRTWGNDVVSSGPGNNPAASAVQTLDTTAAGSGNYRLKFQGQTTVAEIAVGTGKATDIQAALRSLTAIGEGTAAANVNVTEPSAGTYAIAFAGKLANSPQPLIEVVAGSAPPSPPPGLVTTTPGSTGFEICTAAALCKIGTAGTLTSGIPASPAIVPAGGPDAGNVLVADSLGFRVSEFTSAGSFVRSFGWDVVSIGPGNSGATFEVCRAADFAVCKVGVAGNGNGQFGNGAGSTVLAGIAVGSNGVIFTGEGRFQGNNGANFRVQRFEAGTLAPTVYNPDGALSGTSINDTPGQLAVDPTDNHLYVVKTFPAGTGAPPAATPERRVIEVDPALDSGNGDVVDVHLAGAPSGGSLTGLAVRRGGLFAYVTSANPTPGVHVVTSLTAPTATIEPTDPVGATTATLNGSVALNGGPVNTGYRFEYKLASAPDVPASWTRAPASDVNLGNGEGAGDPSTCPAGNPPTCEVSQAIGVLQPLQPNTGYNVRLVASKVGILGVSTGSAGDFTTDPAPPSVQAFPAFWDVSAEELVVRGGVNPNNSPTTYYFQYGTEACTLGGCESVPVSEDAAAGSGGQLVGVSRRLAGLERGTTYHYRVVADNGVGGDAVESPELQFTIPQDVVCANEALREENGSTELPDCRALEWVSNGDSWGMGAGSAKAISPDGNRVQFWANAFNNPDSAPGALSPYTAVREGTRWIVRSALPPGPLGSNGDLLPQYRSSEDLTRSVWPGMTIGQQLRGEVQWMIEGIDGSSIEAAARMVPLIRTGLVTQKNFWQVRGATPNFSAFIFRPMRGSGGSPTGETYLPDEPMVVGEGSSDDSANLYRISDAGTPSSKLEVVNRATNPGPGIAGPVIGGACGAVGNSISEDGAIVYMSLRPTAPAGGVCNSSHPRRLFKRVDGEQTVAIGSLAAPGGDDAYQAASEDGEVVVFTSPRQLAGSDTDATQDLYLYDEDPPGSGQPQLTQVSAGEVVPSDHPTAGSGAQVLSVVGVGSSNVGLEAPATPTGLSGDGSRVYFTARGRLVPEATKGAVNLYVYERSEDHEEGRIDLVATLASAEGSFVPGPDAGAGDGRYLVFTTTTRALPEDFDSSSDVYRYDDETGELVCVSCLGNGSFNVSVGGLEAAPVSDDGATIAFTTSEGLLVDDDLNGVSDAYVWREGVLGLASGGSGQFGASGSRVSRDGKNVVFSTRAALSGADSNNALDLYSARIGGGFPLSPPKVICGSGEECQGPGSGAPAPSNPASPGFSGPGNPPSSKPKPKPCRKGQVRKKGKCVKKKAKAERKRASRNRGGSR